MRISDWSSDVCSSDLKRISINITRLQPDRETGPPSDERGGAIGTETVDGAFIPALPEEAPDREGGLHEEDVVELVEIPFVEQELVKQLDLRHEELRQAGFAEIAIPREANPDRHPRAWRPLHQ